MHRATGATATEIGAALGVPRRTVSDWIRGITPVSLETEAGLRCAECEGAKHEFANLGAPYIYLLGMYLGDGWIAKGPRAHALRIVLDRKYPEIVEECRVVMAACNPASSVASIVNRKDNCDEVKSYSRQWPCLFPQHGPGKKHDRPIVLTGWQQSLVGENPEFLLRGLIQSDGCRFTNTGRGGWSCPRYSLSNRSTDILRIFCDACELVGVHTTRAPHTVYVSRKADVAYLDTFIGLKL